MSSNRREYPKGCFLPMNAVSVHPQGNMHFCLTSTLPSPKNLAELNELREETHKALLEGNGPESCRKCMKKENRGLESRRLRTWLRKEGYYGTEAALAMVHQAGAPKIRHLDISFSNTCNLSCVMCSSEFSSSWFKHDRKAVEEGLEFRDFTLPYAKMTRIPDETFRDIMAHIEEIDVIIIKGGEPTRDPQCLEFLQELAKRKKTHTSVFVQSNGTTPPHRWMTGLENLEFEVGVSMDGWGSVFNWIRGPYFDDVLENMRIFNRTPNIRSFTVEFTLSAYNVFHLPEFLTNMLELKKELSKLQHCAVFHWVQQPYATPLALPLEKRLEVLKKIEPLLEEGGKFFQDSHFLASVLKSPRASEDVISMSQRWFEYLKKMRGYSLGDTESLVYEALRAP